ncbi:hypothetical protein ACS0TY_023462 [Phlomoides rotata]
MFNGDVPAQRSSHVPAILRRSSAMEFQPSCVGVPVIFDSVDDGCLWRRRRGQKDLKLCRNGSGSLDLKSADLGRNRGFE